MNSVEHSGLAQNGVLWRLGGNMCVCVCVGVNEVKPEVVLDCQAVVLSPYGRPLINHAIWLLEYTATLLTNRSFISQEKQDFLP